MILLCILKNESTELQTWVVILNWDGFALCGFQSWQETNMKQEWVKMEKENYDPAKNHRITEWIGATPLQ